MEGSLVEVADYRRRVKLKNKGAGKSFLINRIHVAYWQRHFNNRTNGLVGFINNSGPGWETGESESRVQ